VIALVPVRAGRLPLGGDEAVAEAGGSAILAGDGATGAATHLAGTATEVLTWEQPSFRPAVWAARLAGCVEAQDVVILPASPDGRDLAPRLAAALDRPLVAGAVRVAPGGAIVARQGGLVMADVVVGGPYVATLQPGVRGVEPSEAEASLRVRPLEVADRPAGTGADPTDPELIEVLPPDPATMDLAEAPRIVAAGAGLGSEDDVGRLGRLAVAIGASAGATRVVTDLGWMPADRQIGTTGVTVDPELYVAFGISGAVQHVSGLGRPEHVISVNTDASCPMMALADLALVTDAPALVAALLDRLDRLDRTGPAGG
jgi:electron transfer flavoprotein alpha subunit